MTTHEPKSGFISVDGVRLQTLDWGGDGSALVFLAGYANTPHFFDSVARAFTGRFHVLGLTRRAHGASDQPDDGYDNPTLARDIIGLLDALYRMNEEDTALLAENPLPPSDPPPETFESVAAFCEDFVTRYPTYRRLRSLRWDALWAHSLEQTADGRFRDRIRPETARKLFEGRAGYPPDYAAIRCPVLAFYAFQDEHWSLPDDADDHLRLAMKEHVEQVNARHKRRCIDSARAEIADIVIVEYEDTSHYCFLDREADVIEAMKGFL